MDGWSEMIVILLVLIVLTIGCDEQRESSPGMRIDYATHLQQGIEGIRRAQYEAAEAEFRRCIQIDSTQSAAYLHLGKVLAIQDHPEAMTAFEQAVARNPDAVEARIWLARLYRSQREPARAAAQFEAALAGQPLMLNVRKEYVTYLLGGETIWFENQKMGSSGQILPLNDSRILLERAFHHAEKLSDNAVNDSEARYLAGLALLRMGDYEAAIERLKVAMQMQKDRLDLRVPDRLGVAYYRAGYYRKATETFLNLLRALPETDEWFFRTQWNLKQAYDKLGGYPWWLWSYYRFDQRPESVDKPLPVRFTDVARDLGVAKLDGAGPSAWGDIDGDGDLDLLAQGCDTYLAFYRNDKTRFVDISNQIGLKDVDSGFSGNLVDYDNDGDLDLYIARSGWSGPGPNALYRNDGGQFTDVSAASGTNDGGSGFVSLWGDTDNDGDLDLFIANGIAGDGSSNAHYRNNGNFVETTDEAGLRFTLGTVGAAFGDYDLDGDLDLFVTGFETPNALYRNRGDGTFVDVAQASNVAGSGKLRGYVSFFFDYDNDGDLDILTTCLAGFQESLEGQLVGYTAPTDPAYPTPKLYRNEGPTEGWRFTDVSYEAGFIYAHGVMGGNVGDIDNDGYLDVYFGTGDPDLGRLEPNRFYRNNGNGTFTDLTEYAGMGHLGKGHGITFADYDQDGDLDVYAPQGGWYHGDLFENALYRNESGNQNRWLQITLQGRQSNRSGVGAKLRLTVGNRTLFREVQGSVGFGSTDPYAIHFGLGDADRATRLEVVWSSGTVQVVENLSAKKIVNITEPMP